MRRVALAIVLLAVAMPCYGASSQAASFKTVMSGKKLPLSVPIKSLDSKWRRMTLGGGGGGDLAAVYGAMFGGGGGTYYTTGDTVAIGSEAYLVAYTVSRKPMDFMSIIRSSGQPPKPEQMTAETKLGLSLINVRMIGVLSDIRPFNLQEELTAYAESYAESAQTDSLSNLKNLALAVVMYATDYSDTLPDLTEAEAAKKVLNEYVKDESVFYYPDTGQPYVPNAALSGKPTADIADPARAVVFYEANPADDGTRGAAFVDGHAARLDQGRWEEVKKESGIP